MTLWGVVRPHEVVFLSVRFRSPSDAYFWVRRNIRYSRELGDIWSPPRHTLARKSGDCEDMAALLCSILRAMGYDAYVRVGRVVETGRLHAWVVYYDGEWREVDPSSGLRPGVDFHYHVIADFNERESLIYDREEWCRLLSRAVIET